MEVARSNRVSLTKIAPVKRPVFFMPAFVFFAVFYSTHSENSR